MVLSLTDDQLNSLTTEELLEREQEIVASMGAKDSNIKQANLEELSSSGLRIREEQILARMNETGQQPVDPIPVPPSPVEQSQRQIEVVELSQQPDLFTADPVDISNHLDQYKEDPITWTEAFKEKDKLELIPFFGSLYKFNKLAVLIEDTKIASGERSEFLAGGGLGFRADLADKQEVTEEQRTSAEKRVEDWIIAVDEQQRRGITAGARITQGIMELPSFMVEFMLTGGIFKTGSVAAKKAATRLLGNYADNVVGKLATRAAGAGFGTFARTAVNVPRVLAGAAERMTNNIQITDDGNVVFSDENTPMTALARSFTNLYIENLTEIAGPSLKKGALAVGKGIGKTFPQITRFTDELSKAWIANNPATRTVKGFLKASATKLGYDGILEEMGEEQLGRILQATADVGFGDFRTPDGKFDKQSFVDSIVPTWEDLLVEAGIFAVPGGISLASQIVNRRFKLPTDIERSTDKSAAEILATEQVPIVEERQVPAGTELGEQVIAPVEQKVIDNTVETNTEAIQASEKNASVEASSTADAVFRNVARAEDVVGRWGTAGKKVQTDLREISARTAKNTGTTTQNVKSILKGLSSKDKITVAQLADGAISAKGQPSRLVQRSKQLREQLDIMQNEAIKTGLRTTKLTGKAFPQILNEKGKKFLQEAETKGASSRQVFAWAQEKVNEGKYETVDSAIAALQNYRKNRLRGTEGYFEGRRVLELDLDMREWSPDIVLPGIIEGGWENIEGARQWGVTKDGNFKDIRTSIERIRSEVGRDQANMLEDYIKAQYGQTRASVAARVWSAKARTAQFIGKLAFSPLTITRNMLDRYAKGLAIGTIGTNVRATIQFPPFLNRFMGKSRQVQDEMIRRGAVLGHGHLSEGFDSPGQIKALFGKPFASSERGNQTYIALVKQLQLDADIRALNQMGDRDGTVGKMYDQLLTVVGRSQQQTRNRVLTNLTNDQLADAMTQKEISDDVMSEVLHRTVTDAAFPLTLASKRMWWNSRPWAQTAAQFKIWSADQMRFIHKDVVNYGIKTGDWTRLGRFIIGTWLAGELYNIARDFITGKDESLLSTLKDESGRNPKDISLSIGNALIDGGIVGMVWDLTYGVTDWVLGPTIGSLEEISQIGLEVLVDPATIKDGTKKFLLRDIPAAKQAQGLLDRLDRNFFEEGNMTENYAKWRTRSFEFKTQKARKQVGITKEKIVRAIAGFSEGIPGPRKLSFQMASRQVLVNDTQDAADFLEGIVRDTPIEKLSEITNAIGQSARSNSPFGNVAQKDLSLFLNKFSPEQQAEGLLLQEQWLKTYQKAMEITDKRLRDSGFYSQAEAEAKEAEKEIKAEIDKFKSTLDEVKRLMNE